MNNNNIKHPNYLIDEIGNKYGKLTVISRSENKGNKARWLCQCTCGKQQIITGTDLRSGHTGSCGCGKQTWKSKPLGEASFNAAYDGYVRSAKRRGLSFNLSPEKFREVVKGNCHYCGKEPSSPIRQERHNGKFPFNGIDRLDSSVGYEENNIVPCCFTCNSAKWKMSEAEFLLWIGRVYAYSEKRIHDAQQQMRLEF
jgi:hypothetical protein